MWNIRTTNTQILFSILFNVSNSGINKPAERIGAKQISVESLFSDKQQYYLKFAFFWPFKGNQYEFLTHPRIKGLDVGNRTANLWIAGPLLYHLS